MSTANCYMFFLPSLIVDYMWFKQYSWLSNVQTQTYQICYFFVWDIWLDSIENTKKSFFYNSFSQHLPYFCIWWFKQNSTYQWRLENTHENQKDSIPAVWIPFYLSIMFYTKEEVAFFRRVYHNNLQRENTILFFSG